MLNEHDQDNLIDLHLGQLGEPEAQALRERLQTDPALRAESQAVERTLRLLDGYTVTPPVDLVARVRAGVDRRLQPIRLDPEVVAAGRSGFGAGLMSVRDLVAAAAMIAVAFGLLVPGWTRAREEGRRVLCESQLRNVGLAMTTYAAGFNGQLPFAGYQPGASWLSVSRPGMPVSDNRRHAYLLIRQKLAEPGWFICPSRPDAVVLFVERPEALETFPDYRNTTYSLQCMAGPRPRVTEQPDMPIMADQTPMFLAGRFVRPETEACNSLNHASAGQNVLLMDGRVKWFARPYAERGADNIWLLEDLGLHEYTGLEVPRSSTDAFLVE